MDHRDSDIVYDPVYGYGYVVLHGVHHMLVEFELYEGTQMVVPIEDLEFVVTYEVEEN